MEFGGGEWWGLGEAYVADKPRTVALRSIVTQELCVVYLGV